MNHSTSKPDVTYKCTICYEEFPGFYALRKPTNTQHGFSIKTTNVDHNDIFNEVDDTNLKEELRSCQHFLVDSEPGRSRH